jgi:hypothetical protein
MKTELMVDRFVHMNNEAKRSKDNAKTRERSEIFNSSQTHQ